MGAAVDHGLDGQDQAILQEFSGAAFPVVGNLGLLVEIPSQTVSDKLPNHAVSSCLGVLLDGVPNVVYPVAFAHFIDAHIETFLGNTQ